MSIKCLTPDCPRIGLTRGLCKSCYNTLGAKVRAGKATWTALEHAGKALPLEKRRQIVIR